MAINKFITKYSKIIDNSAAPFLHEMISEWQQTKPLKGVRILHNLINSKEVMLKLCCLLVSGADLTITRMNLPNYQFCQQIDADLQILGSQYKPMHQQLSGHFNIALDCGAQLSRLHQITLDYAVELTGVGTQYFELNPPNIPVMDINQSDVKNLECINGTGESFIRAFKQLVNHSLLNELFIIFGYGKVGRGIYSHLKIYSNNIIIIERNQAIVSELQSKGIEAFHLNDLPNKQSLLTKAFCVITATGVNSLLSKLNLSADSFGDAYLANMGNNDEFGSNFANNRVLFNKFPINFSLAEPTLIKYLDPVFYAHNLSALLVMQCKQNRCYPLPPQIDKSIMQRWLVNNA